MLLQLGAFGIKNNTISLVVDLVILFLVVMWLALIYWTYADARRRIVDPLFQHLQHFTRDARAAVQRLDDLG